MYGTQFSFKHETNNLNTFINKEFVQIESFESMFEKICLNHTQSKYNSSKGSTNNDLNLNNVNTNTNMNVNKRKRDSLELFSNNDNINN